MSLSSSLPVAPSPDGGAPSTARGPRSAFHSLTLRGAVAMAIAYVAGRFGVDLGTDTAQELAARLLDLVFTLGVMAVGVGRARAAGPLA